ncbi:MAG: response regulator [Clostridiales bacterium]|jgi:two-component system response regulator YesN|nr:response regulator [Clostridiales bacterium]
MYKVLLVDDDEIERQGLASLPVFPEHGMRIAGEAWNGKNAMELAEALQPDIVLTDIRMPVMDGLELASKLKVGNPETRIVMMSGYEDFEAVRQALSFGADAYLTKPLNIAELGRVLGRVSASLNSRADESFEKGQLLKKVESMGPILRERLLRDLLLGVRSMSSVSARDEASSAGLFLAREKLAVILLEVEQSASDRMEVFLERVQETLSGMSQALALCAPVVIHGGMLGFIAFMPRRMDDEAAFDHLQQCSAYMVERVRAAIGCPVTIGISSIREDETALASMYCQALETLRKFAGHGSNRAYWHEPESAGARQGPDIESLSREILEIINLQDPKAGEACSIFVDELVSVGASMEELKGSCCELLANMAAVAGRKGQELKLSGSLFQNIISARYAEDIKGCLKEQFSRQKSQRKSCGEVFAEKASAFMRENYKLDLSTDRIAQEVFVTPAHLRRVFKNATGQTIQEYLLAVRMDKARELLRTTEARILDVARDVGYANPSYFNIVFRKYYGKPPGEFRGGERNAE